MSSEGIYFKLILEFFSLGLDLICIKSTLFFYKNALTLASAAPFLLFPFGLISATVTVDC